MQIYPISLWVQNVDIGKKSEGSCYLTHMSPQKRFHYLYQLAGDEQRVYGVVGEQRIARVPRLSAC